MCGIVGLFSKTRLVDASALAPSLTRLRHRGPDDEGLLVYAASAQTITPLGGDDTPGELNLRHWRDAGDVTGNIILGHRRLSILDLSPRGHQPMVSVDGTCWIVFNGEIYNYVELRDELRALGHEFHTGSDTEVILHAWQQWGKDCLDRFNGDWAFCILDTRAAEPTLFIARDRYGIKPLFFVDTPDAFWFASEAKALVGHAVPFKPREHAVARFLFGGELPASTETDTFFEGIFQLPPGEAITVRRDSVERLHWYDLKWAVRKQEKPARDEAVADMASQVDSAVKLRLRADVPVGSCLSGGVDSSSIVGTMRSLLQSGGGGDLHTFSAIYKEKGNFNEVDWIKTVVAHNRSQSHYIYPDDVPLTEVFDRMVWHQDEPFQTASIFAQWCVMSEARKQGVTVLLDGQAADELFGGYQPGSYQEQFLEWLQGRQYGRFLREWVARKFATRDSWFSVICELCQILVNGTTGLLWVGRERFILECILRASAIRPDIAERVLQYAPSDPTKPPYDAAEVAADESATKTKLADHREKLRKWEERRAYLKKKKRQSGEEWVRLVGQIADKKEHIRSNLNKLANVERRKQMIRRHKRQCERDAAAAANKVEPKNRFLEDVKERILNLPKNTQRAFRRLFGEPGHHLRDFLLRQTVSTSLPHLLRFEDRNSMAFSVEARVPFTDHNLVEFAFAKANEYKIHKGWAKWIVREAMEGRAPASILWRRDKTGFEAPDITMTRRLIEHRERNPADSEFLCRFLDRDLVRKACDRLQSSASTRDDGRLVWRWLVLDSWHAQYEKASDVTPALPHAPLEPSSPTKSETKPSNTSSPASLPSLSVPTGNSGSGLAAATKIARKRICIVAFSPTAMDARVQREARALSKYHDVTVAGFGRSPFVNDKTAIQWFELLLNDPDREIPLRKQKMRLWLSKLFPSLLEKYMLETPHFRHAWHMVQASNFDLIYCNDVDTILLGITAKRDNPQTKIILDLHEYPTRELESADGRESHEWLKIRKPLVTGLMKNFSPLADATLTVVDSFVPLFTEEFGMRKPTVIYNAPDFVPLPPRKPSDGRKVRLIHHGACSPFRKLELMIQMMAWLDDRFTLDFMLVGNDAAYLSYLHSEAAKLRPGRVSFRPPVAPGDIVTTIAEYDIGIFLLLPDIFNYYHALPNKFFDFIAAGLGVAVGPTPAMAKIAREHQVGWVSDDFDPHTFANMLNRLTPEDIAACQAASFKLRETLNAETEMKKLVSFVNQVLDPRASAPTGAETDSD